MSDDSEPQPETSQDKESAIVLRKWQLILGIIVGIAIPIVSITGAYYKQKEEVEKRISKVELDTERRFAKKEDVKTMDEKLNTLLTDVAAIKGYLQVKTKNK